MRATDSLARAKVVRRGENSSVSLGDRLRTGHSPKRPPALACVWPKATIGNRFIHRDGWVSVYALDLFVVSVLSWPFSTVRSRRFRR